MEVQDCHDLYEPSLPFLHTLERLKNIPREGWKKRGVRSPESVSDHSFRMVVLCMMLEVCHQILFSRNSDQSSAVDRS